MDFVIDIIIPSIMLLVKIVLFIFSSIGLFANASAYKESKNHFHRMFYLQWITIYLILIAVASK